jgi:ubiquinone/menaquinone biosynthesis C-methylase UbiE
MRFYRDCILPTLVDLSMRNKRLRPYRQRVVEAAAGRVLEIGIGAGSNLPYYGRHAREIFGLDPSQPLLGRARSKVPRGEPIHLFAASAEAIPLEDRSVDTTVTTWAACSIPQVAIALTEVRRVLKPGGRLLFVEHGRAPEPGVARWQERINPTWRCVAGGCNLNRKIDDVIRDAGFRIDRLDTGYMPGPRLFTFLYEGAATPR